VNGKIVLVWRNGMNGFITVAVKLFGLDGENTGSMEMPLVINLTPFIVRPYKSLFLYFHDFLQLVNCAGLH